MKKITNKTKTTKTPKATTTKTTGPIPAGAEPEPGNAQGITINDSTEEIKADESQATEAEVIKPTEQPEATETAEEVRPPRCRKPRNSPRRSRPPSKRNPKLRRAPDRTR